MPGKELITEAQVLAMSPGSQLVLGPDRIATPSALDAAYLRGMRVIDRASPQAGRAAQGAGCSGDSATGGGCGGGCEGGCNCQSGLWSRMKDNGGTFVVEIRDGRAVVTRLGASGPTPFGTE